MVQTLGVLSMSFVRRLTLTIGIWDGLPIGSRCKS